jgi:hypothetical protein
MQLNDDSICTLLRVQSLSLNSCALSHLALIHIHSYALSHLALIYKVFKRLLHARSKQLVLLESLGQDGVQQGLELQQTLNHLLVLPTTTQGHSLSMQVRE